MGWWKTARHGDKIVCVNDAEMVFVKPGYSYSPGLDGLRAGVVYTVDFVYETTTPTTSCGICVAVREVDRGDKHNNPGFAVERFRPVQKRSTETGMAILRKLLDRAPIQEDAR